jgi:hypothetical protein
MTHHSLEELKEESNDSNQSAKHNKDNKMSMLSNEVFLPWHLGANKTIKNPDSLLGS